MSKEGNFLVYCTERYKSAKRLTGRQVSDLFSKYSVWNYIYSCFEALHTTGENYIIEDIDLRMKTRRLYDALGVLSPREREIVVLRYGLSGQHPASAAGAHHRGDENRLRLRPQGHVQRPPRQRPLCVRGRAGGH